MDLASLPPLTSGEVNALQSSLLFAEVKSVVAHVLVTWCQCLCWAGATRRFDPEQGREWEVEV